MTIETDNDAVQEAWDLAQLLKRVGRRLQEGHDEGVLLDVNGNTVGSWSWT